MYILNFILSDTTVNVWTPHFTEYPEVDGIVPSVQLQKIEVFSNTSNQVNCKNIVKSSEIILVNGTSSPSKLISLEFFLAHLCTMHGGLICITFCLSVCLSVRL